MKSEKQDALLLALEKGWLIADPETGKCWTTRPVGSPLVRSVQRREIGYLARNGYREASIQINGVQYHFLLHQLIWLSSKGRIPKGLELNHIDGVKTNNRIVNLELVTRSENAHHAFQSGLRVGPKLGRVRGSVHYAAKLTEHDIPKIRQFRKEGLSLGKIAARFRVSRRAIQFVLNGKHWKHVKEERL